MKREDLKKLSREQKESLAMEVLNKCYNPSDDRFTIRMLNLIIERIEQGYTDDALRLLVALTSAMEMQLNTDNNEQ